MTAEHDREQVVQVRLRALTYLVLALASVSVMLSFITLTKTSPSGLMRTERAMDWTHRLWNVIVLLPAAWVLRSPRLRPVLTWAGWAILSGFGLEAVTRGMPVNVIETVKPGWVQLVILGVWLISAAIVVIAMPMIRFGDSEPAAGLPAARVHHD